MRVTCFDALQPFWDDVNQGSTYYMTESCFLPILSE